jgi:DNA-binding NarL/FixJ family response regulator
MPSQLGTQPQGVAARIEPPIGVLVVDDHLAFRQVVHEVVGATGDFEMLGEASSGTHALAAADELHPDLVLLDVRMPGMDGIETAARLRTDHPQSVVVLITVEEPLGVRSGASACGAAELVRKQDFCPSLLRRVWRTHGRPS